MSEASHGCDTGRAGRKSATRARILAAAAALFRTQGIAATGVDAVMRGAGLTHGGFYAHFASKEALVAAVAAEQLARVAARWSAMATGPDGATALGRIVAAYLHADHVDHAEGGCLLPSVGPELARRPDLGAKVFDGVRDMVAALEACVPAPPEEARRRAIAALSCMVGAVLLARLAGETAWRRDILDAAQAMLLGGGDSPPRSACLGGVLQGSSPR